MFERTLKVSNLHLFIHGAAISEFGGAQVVFTLQHSLGCTFELCVQVLILYGISH